MWVKISEKNISVPVWNLFAFLGKIMVWKYGQLILLQVFPDKIPVIDFTDEAVVQFDVPVVKIPMQVLVIFKWLQINFDMNTYVLSLDPVLCIVLISEETEAYNSRSWLYEEELAC